MTFYDSLGNLNVSAYTALKNNSDKCIGLSNARMDFEDNNGRLLTTDQYANCIPEVAKPGQILYVYTYYMDITGIDTSNGLNYISDGDVYEATNYYEITASDISFRTNDLLDVSIIGRGTNNTGTDHYADPGAVFYDSNNNVVGFCYGLEQFNAGQTTSFEISGDMLSNDYDPSIVDHVDVFIQGDSFY